jgi:hypothetical protein
MKVHEWLQRCGMAFWKRFLQEAIVLRFASLYSLNIKETKVIMENGKAVNNLSAYYEKKSTPTVKSYRNAEYLNSAEARTIRIQCELEESKWRLKRENVKGM